MAIIGFFRDLTTSFGSLIGFVSTPLGQLSSIELVEPFNSMSIFSLLGVSLVATLTTLLAIHLIRLFVGG